MKYIVFGADYCPWCLKTKELLKSKKKKFEYYQTHDSDALQKYGSYIPDDYMFIPKVLVIKDNKPKFLGGYTELVNHLKRKQSKGKQSKGKQSKRKKSLKKTKKSKRSKRK